MSIRFLREGRGSTTLLMSVALLVVSLGFVSALRAGDLVETVDGAKVDGRLKAIRDGSVTLDDPAKPDAAAREHRFADLHRFSLDPLFDRVTNSLKLIDNDGAQVGRTLSKKVKLRAGMHRFVIPYWHGQGNGLLRLQYSGPKQSLRMVPASMIYHLPEGASETRSPGVDAEGFRQPEVISDMRSGLIYTLHKPLDPMPKATVANFLSSEVTLAGGQSSDKLSLTAVEPDMGMISSGFLKIPADGEYTFLLSSDGGSQLYLGPAPRFLRAMEVHRQRFPWKLKFITGDTASGQLTGWSDGIVHFEVPTSVASVTLDVPDHYVRELARSAPAKPGSESSADEANAEQDTVFAKGTEGDAVRSVTGRVTGIDGDFLLFRFEDQDRRIKLDRVMRIVLSSGRERPAEATKYQHQLALSGGGSLPGHLTSLDGLAIQFRTLWGQEPKLMIDDILGVTVRYGRLVFLSDLPPTTVEEVPFFDRVVSYRVDQSLFGGPLTLKTGKQERGISMHSRSALHYDVGGSFQKFRCTVGFDSTAGDLGRVALRVLGDGKPIFENNNYTASDAPLPLDLDISAVKQLTLVVDFGEGDDVGDAIIWANARLVRAEINK